MYEDVTLSLYHYMYKDVPWSSDHAAQIYSLFDGHANALFHYLHWKTRQLFQLSIF